MLEAWVEEKQLIRKRFALTELRDRLSQNLLLVPQRCARLGEIEERIKRAGNRVVEMRQVGIAEFQGRIRRAVLSHSSKRLKVLDQRTKRAGRWIVEKRQKRLAEIQERTRRAWGSTIPSKIVSRVKDSFPGVWYQCELDPLDCEWVARWKPSADDRKRLEWARRGEKAALLYYRTGLRRHAVDISIQQLDGLTTEWKSHDLQVDGRPLDVKNVRCPNLDRFQEHWWRHHKRNRDGDQVGIVGSVSAPRSDGGPEGSLVLVIGEVTDSDVLRLSEEVNATARSASLSVEIRLNLDWRERVPGWLFEYPEIHYASGPNWENVLPRCRIISRDLGLPVAPWLVGLEAARRGPRLESRRLKRTEEAMFGFLRRVGLSRRTLFLFVLMYMLSHSHNSKAREELVDRIFHGDERSLPLGLHDPRNYVWHLLQALEQMIKSNVELLRQATNFQLVGVNILKARIEPGGWHTILAYCGSCGRWPIFLGKSKPCACGRRRLICDDPSCCSCGLDLPDCKNGTRAGLKVRF